MKRWKSDNIVAAWFSSNWESYLIHHVNNCCQGYSNVYPDLQIEEYYLKINFLLLNRKYVVGSQKNRLIDSFEHPKHIFKLMDKKNNEKTHYSMFKFHMISK